MVPNARMRSVIMTNGPCTELLFHFAELLSILTHYDMRVIEY